MADRTNDVAPLVTVAGMTSIHGERLTGRQRAIVAALAFHGRAGTTTEVLIDIVWQGSPPKAARQSLQNQITRLRRRFGPDLIQTDIDGYRLMAETDVQRFQEVTAPWVDRPASPEAIGPLVDALAGWRGEPYVDLDDFVPVEAERCRLLELHARAEEQLAVCRMVAGEHGRAADQLTALVTEDPYRERRWKLLVLAHHLDGRQTDALAAYERAERRFADDLRARPSALLIRLRDRIAAGETIELADLEVVATTAAVGEAPAPRDGRATLPAVEGGHGRARSVRGRCRVANPAR